jgi:hypothetical protein
VLQFRWINDCHLLPRILIYNCNNPNGPRARIHDPRPMPLPVIRIHISFLDFFFWVMYLVRLVTSFIHSGIVLLFPAVRLFITYLPLTHLNHTHPHTLRSHITLYHSHGCWFLWSCSRF